MKAKLFIYLFSFTLLMVGSAMPRGFAWAQSDDEIAGETEEFSDDFGDESGGEMAQDSLDEDAEIESEIEAQEKTTEPQVAEKVEEEPMLEEPAETPQEVTSEELEPPTDNLDQKVEEPTEVAEPEIPPSEPMEPESPQELATRDLEDAPDLQYEAKLHDIYVNFYKSKTPEAEWNALVGSRQSERYQIQSGDNLWDISKTLFGDGHYWPKVWSLNAGIENPHLISPNNSIRFLLGDESEPPAFTVTENASDDTPAAGPTAKTATGKVNDDSDETGPEIPEPLAVSRPVVKHLPPSFPVWQSAGDIGEYDDLGFDYTRRKIADAEDTIPLQSYLSESAPTSLGQVSEIEVGNNIASAYQYIYVSMKKGYGEVGENYLVVANRGPIQSVHSTIKGFLGYSVDVQGEIQLVERVAGREEEKYGQVFRALVLRILNPVGVGSILTQGSLEKVKITEEGPRSQVVAQIIGGSFFNRRQIYGTESIAYLNRGTDDGLEVGQILPIRANRLVRNENTRVNANVRPIGWLRVVRTTPHFATTVVVRAWSDVLTGDLTGSGDLLPQMGAVQGSGGEFEGTQAASLQEELGSDDAVDVPQNGTNGETDFSEDEDFREDAE